MMIRDHQNGRPIERLLIANRGEIAVRVALGARGAGIVPLGVYSEADSDAYFLRFMDDAAPIGAPEATASYLSIENILGAAHELNADAIHPGYGFLSERPLFARAVREAGFIFVGPLPEAMEAMGDKAAAKKRARELGIPVVPGYDGEDQSFERLRVEAEVVGLPLFIKASAGGGGRGMRIVKELAEFEEALASARREALGAFGDDRVLLERYIAEPRHIEFQILADAHGNVVYYGERECSIQRRHQKLLEEAPSTALSAELRTRMGEAAVAIARSVGYTNAGTVEFLLDRDGAFYFLEVNARLQVEHPVTEAIYGVDLVRKQLEIASGAPLGVSQSEIVPRGWAIEARINAEDPNSGYLPATGTILHWSVPMGPGIRLDSGVSSGSTVSPYYDSMIAKLIAWGADRPAAIERLTSALEQFEIDGVATNLPLQLRIARDVTFRAGYTTTAFLVEHGNFLRPDPAGEPEEAFVIAVGALLADPRVWRVGGVDVPLTLRGQARTFAVTAVREAPPGTWSLSGDAEGSVAFEYAGDRVTALVAGRRCSGRVTIEVNRSASALVHYEGGAHRFGIGDLPSIEGSHHRSAGTAAGTINSPMPGKIVRVAVKPGDVVEERDLLIVLEAMKMEHRIEAPHAGTVRRVEVATGATVGSGAALVEIDE